MAIEIPEALQERLGAGGTDALAAVLTKMHNDTVTFVTDRFEQRLINDCGKLRTEFGELRSDLRTDMKELRADVRVQIVDLRSELLKWSFLSWVSQLGAVIGVFALLR